MNTILLGFLAAALSFVALGAGGENQIDAVPDSRVQIVESSHRIEFPDRIVINLSAEGSADVRSVRLFYTVGPANARVYTYPKSFRNTGPMSAEFVIRTDRGGFIPQGVDIEYYYVFTDPEGLETESDRFSFPYLDPRYNWKRREYDDFTLIWHDRSDRAVRSVGGSVSVRMAAVKRLLGLDGDYDFKAVLINDRAEASRSFPPVSQTSQDVSLYAGFALGDYGTFVLAGLNQDGMVHELTHLMVDEAVNTRLARVPAWLNEGIAMYFEPSGSRRESELAWAAGRGDLLRLRHMRTVPGRPDDVRLFYAQSASVVRFMADRFGEDRLANLFSAIGDGQSAEQAIATTYGMTVDQLDAAWRGHITGRGASFEMVNPGSLGTSALIGGALVASASVATVGWLKRMRGPAPAD